jgi:YidC/Oxa1 family membrane protein insertase
MPNESNRNLIIFMAVAMVVLFAYQFLVIEPASKKRMAEARLHPTAVKVQPGQVVGPDGKPAPIVVPREQAMGSPALRRPIVNPQLRGSLSLTGGRIDDLALTHYEQTAAKGSPPVQLLNPEGSKDAWYTNFGWSGRDLPGLPGPATVWTLKSGDTLSPGKPVVLTYTSPQNLVFERTISVDDKFMFTVSDTVVNQGAAPVTLSPYAQVVRQGLPVPPPPAPALGANGIVHEGAIGVFGADGKDLQQLKYPSWIKKPATSFDRPGWLGITDKYWLVTVAPNPAQSTEGFSGRFTATPGTTPVYQADFARPGGVNLPVGGRVSQSTLLFAGVKVEGVLEGYETNAHLPNFRNAIDWGHLWFLTQPMFRFLEFLKSIIGSFGLSILALTLCVRLVLFPLANKSYESMTKMKKLQPQLEELKVKHKDDQAKQQQEMMAIYAREKINPMMGCLPMLLQIPIFFSVYKVLSVTIEMRHTGFLGWIKDLSGQDPTSIWNLFGAIPWHPETLPMVGTLFAGHLHLGVLPLLYGFTMWLTTAMNPPAPDPMQQRIFQLMPIMFTFIMATFPVGLLIYWTWSNVLSILQQYLIMHRLKVDNPIDKFIKGVRGIGHHQAAG